jgi:methionyl-tRNA formyltransferase
MTGGIVIITGDDLEHRFVANEICRRFEVEAILIVDPVKRRSWKTVLKKSFLEFADKALWRILLKVTGDSRARQRSLIHVFGRENCESFHQQDKTLRVGRPKAGRLLREVERLRPDLIAIYGTGIIPDAVLNKAATKSLNMHTGISPEYRGAACAFWPIYDGRPEFVGATVHECTSRVDGGEVYFKSRAQLFRDDDLHAIFARAAKVGAEGYVEVIERATADTLVGAPQDLAEGAEFRGSMRGFRAEVVARLRLRGLRRTWPAQKR